MATNERLRLLLVPNEGELEQAVGVRSAFRYLRAHDLIADLAIFSFMVERERLGDEGWQTALQRLSARFRPDVIFWQHVEYVPVAARLLEMLKAGPGRPKLVYHEEDMYSRLAKRVRTPLATVLRAADLVLLSGTHHMVKLARAHGARMTAFLDHCFDMERFGTPWQPTRERPFDAVFIGSRIRSRKQPILRLPGAFHRDVLVRRLSRELGPRLAVYGPGWEHLPNALGPLPYGQQTGAIRKAWISVNWDHFHREFNYSSDRLPISLAAGVPHVTTWHPGYDEQFAGCEALFPARTVRDALALTRWLLGKTPDELIALGEAGRRYALDRMQAAVVYAGGIDTIIRLLFPERPALPAPLPELPGLLAGSQGAQARQGA